MNNNNEGQENDNREEHNPQRQAVNPQDQLGGSHGQPSSHPLNALLSNLLTLSTLAGNDTRHHQQQQPSPSILLQSILMSLNSQPGLQSLRNSQSLHNNQMQNNMVAQLLQSNPAALLSSLITTSTPNTAASGAIALPPANPGLPANHVLPANTLGSNATEILLMAIMQQRNLVPNFSASSTTNAGTTISVNPMLQQHSSRSRNEESSGNSYTNEARTGGSLVLEPPTSSVLPPTNSSGGRSLLLYTSEDDATLTPYQCLIRKQIELFEATEDDVRSLAQGRNRPICLGQVGIRCRHCGPRAHEQRARGAIYYPSALIGGYQSSQNMANTHLIEDCVEIPRSIQEDLIRLKIEQDRAKHKEGLGIEAKVEQKREKKRMKSAHGSGRLYWAECLRKQGVAETDDRRLKFVKQNTAGGVPDRAESSRSSIYK